jgi:hypothetical protein
MPPKVALMNRTSHPLPVALRPTWRRTTAAGVTLALALCCTLVGAQQADRSAEKLARRAQQQMQALQQQLQQAQAEKSQLDGERAEMAKKLQGREQLAGRAAAAQRAADEKLKAAEAERLALAAKVAELEKMLEDRKRSSEETVGAKDKLLAAAVAQLKRQDAAQGVLLGRFDEQMRSVAECSEKNERLTRLSAELLDRYRNKGLWEAARQREPILGLSDVQTFNLVQAYRDRAEAERFAPSIERR